MPTINQLLRKRRVRPLSRNKVPALEKQPLKRGVCVKVYTTTPKNEFVHKLNSNSLRSRSVACVTSGHSTAPTHNCIQLF